MGLMKALGRGPVALAAVVFICLIEEHPAFLLLIAPVFTETAQGRLDIVTSAVTLLEVLVVPYRAGNQLLAERNEPLVTRSRGVRLLDIDRIRLRAAAQLRTRYAVRAPDAIQLAAALSQRCSAFVTDDRAGTVYRAPRLVPWRGANPLEVAHLAKCQAGLLTNANGVILHDVAVGPHLYAAACSRVLRTCATEPIAGSDSMRMCSPGTS